MNAFLVRFGPALVGLAVVVLATIASTTVAARTTMWEMRPPHGATPGGGDCNDNDPNVYPGHVEIVGNRVDDDCDGLADEDANDNPSGDTNDFDGDGVSLAMGDCNDTTGGIHPGAVEVVGNYVDDDCDGLADEDAADHPSNDAADHDGDQVIIAPDAIFASGFESAS